MTEIGMMTPHCIDYYEDPNPGNLSLRKLKDEDSEGVGLEGKVVFKSVPNILAAVQDFTNEDVAFLFQGSMANLRRN
jgi:hypothetical protein